MSSITGLRTIIGEKEQKESFYLEEIERLKVIIDQSAVQRERMVEVEVIARKDAEQREINIQSDLAKLKQNYQTATDTVSALSREVEFVRRQYAMLQQEYANLQRTAQNQVYGLQQQMHYCQQQFERSQQSLLLAKSEIDTIKELCEKRQGEVASASQQLERLQLDHDRKCDDVEKYLNLIENQKTSVVEIQEAFDTAKKETEDIRSATDEVIKNLQIEVQAAMCDCVQSRNEIASLKLEFNSSLSSFSAEKDKDIERLRLDLQNSKQESDKLQAELLASKDLASKFEQQSSMLTREVAYTRQQYTMLQQQAQATVQQLQQHVMQCQQQWQQSQQMLKARETEKQLLEQKVTELEKGLQQIGNSGVS